MKTTSGFLAKAITYTVLAHCSLVCAPAAPIPAPGFGVETYYTHSTSANIVSFDRDASNNLYYMTAPPGFGSGIDFWKSSGGTPTNLFSNGSSFAGNSVVKIGDYVYFNDGNFPVATIRSYGPLTGVAALAPVSTTTNYGLYAGGGGMLITASNPNHIYYSALAGDGDLVNDPAKDLGETVGNSGPLTLDGAGNLYYAPGFGDMSVYKFSSAELAAAIANPVTNPLTVAGHQWLDYTAIYGPSGIGGATSMVFDSQGDLIMSLTNFTGASVAAIFGADGTGAYDGTHATMATETGRIGELRNFDGNTYLSSSNGIYKLVPEPGSIAILSVGAGLLALARRRRNC